MFYHDLELYRYGLPVPLSDVVTVGWLSKEHGFPTGEIDIDLLRALEKLLYSHRVNPYRGRHVCEFCSAPVSYQGIILGSAEIWLPSLDGNVIFAAPDLIYHYIAAHGYRPPAEFAVAAIRASQKKDWDANQESEKRLTAAFQ
jgi:hypothetical protein